MASSALARPARRRTTWARYGGFSTIGAASSVTLNVLSGYSALPGASLAGITIGRTLINLSITANPVAGDIFTWGLIRGQDTDAGSPTPVGAPVPATHTYEDWAWWEQTTSDSVGPSYWSGVSNQRWVDVRSKRKLPELQMAWNLVLQAQTSGSLHISYAVSTLLLLP